MSWRRRRGRGLANGAEIVVEPVEWNVAGEAWGASTIWAYGSVGKWLSASCNTHKEWRRHDESSSAEMGDEATRTCLHSRWQCRFTIVPLPAKHATYHQLVKASTVWPWVGEWEECGGIRGVGMQTHVTCASGKTGDNGVGGGIGQQRDLGK